MFVFKFSFFFLEEKGDRAVNTPFERTRNAMNFTNFIFYVFLLFLHLFAVSSIDPHVFVFPLSVLLWVLPWDLEAFLFFAWLSNLLLRTMFCEKKIVACSDGTCCLVFFLLGWCMRPCVCTQNTLPVKGVGVIFVVASCPRGMRHLGTCLVTLSGVVGCERVCGRVGYLTCACFAICWLARM